MFPRAAFFVRQALAALRRSLGLTALAVVTIGIALAILSTFGLVVSRLASLADSLGREVEISAYLAIDSGAQEAAELASRLDAWTEVASTSHLSSSEALGAFRAELGEDGVLLDGLPGDVIPASIEIRLAAKAWSPEEVAALSARISALPGIEDVRYGQEDVERVHALLAVGRVVLIVMGIALCLATVLIVVNTIRLTVYARRDEIEIMSLVGATNAFVRAPFILEGIVQGLLGGAFAVLAMVLVEDVVEATVERGLSFTLGYVDLDIVPVELAGYVLLVGAALGFLASLVAVGRFLRV